MASIFLRRLAGLDMFVSYWGPTLHAYTIMSWGFEGAPASRGPAGRADPSLPAAP
jgi:hypothetical protein